ncbi:MAG TPA: TIGR00266 family protein [Bryobacteraceae bacterium]|nr:TIGR00266 family protein [Bryobacteraceae bacterium]
MAFCTNCGNKVSDDARFCAACGSQMGAPAGTPVGFGTSMPGAGPGGSTMPPPPPPINAHPLDYTIQGDNLQVARVKLRPGQEIFAEAGKMLYKTPSVQWETRMQGDSIGSKIWGALKRKLMGESLFMTYFRALSDGEVGFAGSYPGRIQAFDLAPGQSILVQRDSFLFAQSGVQLNIAFVKRLGAGFFGGEGFILEKLTGPGTVFIHGGGDFVDFSLRPGEVLQVDTGCIVAFDEAVTYDIQFVGGIKTAIFGGEGLFLATMTGPGRVIVQSMTLEKLRRELAPGTQGGDERNPLGTFTNIFGSED